MPNTSYKGPERRAPRHGSDPVTNDDLDEALAVHSAEERKYFEAVIAQITKEAFPDGAVKHGEYHQAKINAAKSEEKFWSELKLDLAKKGLWGIITILAGMVILGFSAWVTALPHTVPK